VPHSIDPRLLKLTQAPWSRPRSIARVSSVVTRYELMADLARASDASSRGRLSFRMLMQHPSAHLEARSLSPELIPLRLEAAQNELTSLRAAAPLPAPIDRIDRTFVLALADVEHLMRELLHLRRASRRAPPDALLVRYASSKREDPLDELDLDLLGAIRSIRRGHVFRTCAALAAVRHHVPDLRARIAPEKPERPISGERKRVCRAEEIHEGGSRTVEAFGRTIAVFRDHGRLCAIDDQCPHRGGPLNLGDLENGAVICPLHGWAFDLQSGAMRGNPRIVVPTYDVCEEGGEVWVGATKRHPGK
jgi:nitrite reductase (NADH) small subunit